MRYQRRFQTFKPGKAQKLLRWSALDFLGLILVLPQHYEHASTRALLATILGVTLMVLLTLWWKHHRYESRRIFD
jgi:hypothetical protein